MKKEKQYQCVGCAFYDELEMYATLKKMVGIEYVDANGTTESIKTIIKDILTKKDKAEYLVTNEGLEIRLDKILSVVEVSDVD